MFMLVLFLTVIMSLITFVFYGVDKYKAAHHRWRIPETVLLALAFLCGGAGALLGMLVFHHKTRKWKFRVLVPLFTVLQVLVLLGVSFMA